MTTLNELPCEIKLEIAANLDSTADFIALSQTCSELRSIKHYKSIRRKVFENETKHRLTPELIALWNVRHFKSQHETLQRTNQGLGTSRVEFQAQTDEQIISNLSDIAGLRRVIRWFTVQFFEYNLRERPGEDPPTATEISRIDNAFCALWFWMETPYDLLRFTPQSSDTPRQLDNLVMGLTCSTSDAAVRLSVYSFLRSQLAAMKQVYQSTNFSPEAVGYLAQVSPCITRYLNIGVPNMLLMKLGLDGVKKLLTDLEKQHPCQLAPVLAHPTTEERYPYDEEQLITYFTSMINSSRDSSTTTALGRRPLWKNGHNPSWSQAGIDPKIVFWDDARLRRWGYNYNVNVGNRGMIGVLWGAGEKRQHCLKCLPEWQCSYQM
ncbi:hypothetical protein TWF281_010988 [Arthrobotrys megalospora]